MLYFTIQNGEHLIKPNDPSDSFYFIINGQLRVQQKVLKDGLEVFSKIGEYSSTGSCIGLKELMQERNHTHYTTAVRDTELIQFDKFWVTQLMKNNPKGMQNLIKTALSDSTGQDEIKKKIIGVVPITKKVPVLGFLCNLVKVMKIHGSIKIITEDLIQKKFGVLSSLTTFSSHQNIWNYLVYSYFKANVNAKYDFVFCLCKPNLSPWTRWMLKHVDSTLIVGHEEFPAELTDWEFSLNFYNSSFYLAEKRLIILHNPSSEINNSNEFLTPRRKGIGKISMWHHIYEGNHAQYESLARFISGNAIGLVLGGGGARGISHIGTIKALREAGIPFDLVAGVSMGSQIGGLIAAGTSLTQMSHMIWKVYVVEFLADFTFPYMSLLSGRIFSQRLKKYLGMKNKRIEDLTLPYFCLSCNLSNLEEHIHTDGPLWEALRASSSLPLLLPPMLMDSGDLLVDGGYVNNLPVDVMRSNFGANIVIAVDVGDYSKLHSKGFKEYMSGWMILIDGLIGRDISEFPTVYELLLQLAGVLDFQKQTTRDEDVDLIIRPDLQSMLGFKVSSFKHFHFHEKLIESGYQSTKNLLKNLVKEKPVLCNRIMKKTSYPEEMTSGPKPLPFRQQRIFDYLVGTFAHPKLIVILLILYGVYKVVYYVMTILYFTHRQSLNVINLIFRHLLARLKPHFKSIGISL